MKFRFQGLAIFFVAYAPVFAQAPPTDAVRGWEFAAAVNLVPKDVKAEATIFIPQKVSRIRAVLVVIKYGLGFQFANAPQTLKLAEKLDAAVLGVQFSNVSPNVVDKGLRATGDGIHDALLGVLQSLAGETGHQELTDAPLLFWGHSAGGGAAESFVKRFPDRILAFVLYHSAGGGGDPAKASIQIPTLIIHAGKDTTVLGAGNGPDGFWKRGRSGGAPWTFAVEPEAAHGDLSEKAVDLMVAWITCVVNQRLPSTGTTLRPVADGSTWLGNNQTGEAAPNATFSGSKADASWLPDEASARGWQTMLGIQK
jgi:hypothetical protein